MKRKVMIQVSMKIHLNGNLYSHLGWKIKTRDKTEKKIGMRSKTVIYGMNMNKRLFGLGFYAQQYIMKIEV